MTTFVALLRGINVSGHKVLRMTDLRASCEAMGLLSVVPYLQSGNVVFAANETDPWHLAAILKARIAQDFGHDVEVLVLPAEGLLRLVNSNPFGSRIEGDETSFHCTFLFQPVPEDRFRSLDLPVQPREEAAFVEGAVMLHCPHGYGRTKLNNGFFEKSLGVVATTRNWRTVLALSDLCAKR